MPRRFAIARPSRRASRRTCLPGRFAEIEAPRRLERLGGRRGRGGPASWSIESADLAAPIAACGRGRSDCEPRLRPADSRGGVPMPPRRWLRCGEPRARSRMSSPARIAARTSTSGRRRSVPTPDAPPTPWPRCGPQTRLPRSARRDRRSSTRLSGRPSTISRRSAAARRGRRGRLRRRHDDRRNLILGRPRAHPGERRRSRSTSRRQRSSSTCDAVVSHAGSGTCSPRSPTAVPLVLPAAGADQFENAQSAPSPASERTILPATSTAVTFGTRSSVLLGEPPTPSSARRRRRDRGDADGGVGRRRSLRLSGDRSDERAGVRSSPPPRLLPAARAGRATRRSRRAG